MSGLSVHFAVVPVCGVADSRHHNSKVQRGECDDPRRQPRSRLGGACHSRAVHLAVQGWQICHFPRQPQWRLVESNSTALLDVGQRLVLGSLIW